MSVVRKLACIAPLLAACSTPMQRDASPASASATAFTVAQDYEGAYRRVLENARRCWPPTTPAGQRDVQGALDNQAASAHVAFGFRARDGADTRLLVDLKSADRTRTDVRISGPASAAAAVRGWLEGSSVECP